MVVLSHDGLLIKCEIEMARYWQREPNRTRLIFCYLERSSLVSKGDSYGKRTLFSCGKQKG